MQIFFLYVLDVYITHVSSVAILFLGDVRFPRFFLVPVKSNSVRFVIQQFLRVFLSSFVRLHSLNMIFFFGIAKFCFHSHSHICHKLNKEKSIKFPFLRILLWA